MDPAKKKYLGDSVYVRFDGEREVIELTTNNGVRDSNTIVLDVDVLLDFEEWLRALRREVAF